MTPRIWLIAGPTASGKSALALRLAQALGAEIVGADALQIYRDLPILTARPTAAEQALVPHHLVGGVDGAEGWSVGRWLSAARNTLDEIAVRGRSAVVVGGTGLYFHALTRGLAQVPAVPIAVRMQAQGVFDEGGEVVFRGMLRGIDAASEARISPGDRQRLVRAWEVWLATGQSLTDWQASSVGGLPSGSWSGAVIVPDRAALYDRCDSRMEMMMEAGVLAEVAGLAARNLNPALPILKAVGYPQLAAHLRGELSRDQALEVAQRETRRYAKRQTTWMRGQMVDWPKIETLDPDAQWRAFLALYPNLTL